MVLFAWLGACPFSIAWKGASTDAYEQGPVSRLRASANAYRRGLPGSSGHPARFPRADSPLATLVFRRANQEPSGPSRMFPWRFREGEVLGLIGRNCSGRPPCSIFSRASRNPPPAGRKLRRVGSLLEVGPLHRITGRKNAYLSGAILGMKRQEIAT